MNISSCGINCSECEHINVTCTGCRALNGKPFWTKFDGMPPVCPLYDCAHKRGYKDCGDCAELPCKLFLEMKDPHATEEQHQEGIKTRVGNLRN